MPCPPLCVPEAPPTGGKQASGVDQRGLRFLCGNIPTELAAVEVVHQVREKGMEGRTVAFVFHAVFLACSIIGLGVALYGVFLVVRKHSLPHHPVPTSLTLPGGMGPKTDHQFGLVILTGMGLFALGAVLWKEVPWDVVGVAPETAPARPSGPTPEPPQPSTVVQSPAPVPPATPSAQPQPPSTPEDAADNARKVVIWKSITNQINGLSALLDNVASEANKWKADNSDSTAQSISEMLQSASNKFYNMRVNLELLSGSYPQYREIGDVFKEVRRSPGAAPIPGNLFDRLQRSLGFDSSVSKDIAMPYVETMLSNIKDFKEWQRTTLQKAPR
jgi:hypothetical protein